MKITEVYRFSAENKEKIDKKKFWTKKFMSRLRNFESMNSAPKNLDV